MIFAILGGVGSGKSVTATKKVVDSVKTCFVNFDVMDARLRGRKVLRLRKEHIIIEKIVGYKKDGTPKIELEVNWKFWNKALHEHGEYHIFLDEIHNIAHARQSMTKWNTLFSMWISQVRKVLGDSERTHIYLISQKLYRIDVAFRDLLHGIIYCEKKVDESRVILTRVRENIYDEETDTTHEIIVNKYLPVVWVINHYFVRGDIESKFNYFEIRGRKNYDMRTGFIANPYFQYYNSYEMFGETAYL